ncbi:hypothetical protein PoMZ_11439 [Pyricularia oryzae]|uniref:Uncharacterized protein n=1 Tax=Pyricularia oryzae TaxID=318829 RepID=A0A4P7NKC3_PYROR|nr:hypothetical protein PoMZ_11439 [Pyricularia oryzae]
MLCNSSVLPGGIGGSSGTCVVCHRIIGPKRQVRGGRVLGRPSSSGCVGEADETKRQKKSKKAN